MKTIATDGTYSIGYDEDDAPLQTDIHGDELPASEGAAFSDADGQEYRVDQGRWIKTDAHGRPTKDPAAVSLGRRGGLKGGRSTSEAKQAAARANGAKGGRPKKQPKE